MVNSLISDSQLELCLLPYADPSEGGRWSASDEGLAVLDLRSADPLPDPGDLPLSGDRWDRRSFQDTPLAGRSSPDRDSPSPTEMWMEGGVLMCACPDCQAPMTVRLWLLIADCWQCGTSIELSERQQREAHRLLEGERSAVPSRRVPSAARSAAESATRSAPPPLPAEPPTRKPPGSKPPGPEPAPGRFESPAAPPPVPPPAREAAPVAKRTPTPPPDVAPQGRRVTAAETLARRRLEAYSPGRWVGDAWDETPAWLVSLVFHLILLILLALLTIPQEDTGNYIVLNAQVSQELRREGQQEIPDPAEEIRFDLPIPERLDVEDRATREALVRADQEARELRLTDDSHRLPDLAEIKQQIGSPDGSRTALAARDPRVRVEVLRREGGTTLTEAAVARGLRWLAQEQQPDGRWRLDGAARSDSAATSLALLPFLGAGQTHLTGRYQAEVAQGLRWMVRNQDPDGDLRVGSAGNTGMYAHGQGAIVLCEAFLMTGDEALREPAQKATDFIVAAQYADGGWRYKPDHEAAAHERRGDTSVIGWQLMALHSARAAGLHVPDETLELAAHFLDSVQSHDGARYAYQPGNRPTHVMTAEALLCRIYLGGTRSEPGLMQGVHWLLDEFPPHADAPDVYYWYYAAQTLRHVGGEPWEQWNRQLREVLVESQERTGRHAGSWRPRGPHASAGGRIYMTSLAVCTLEIYYRHLPIFRQIQLD